MFDIDFIPKNIYYFNSENNQKYYTKIDVIKSQLHPLSFSCVFDDNKWNEYDWETEPSESFDDLLNERCKQLRDKHKKLTLYFSGGADSETMLRAFYESNTFVDEVVLTVLEINKENPLKDNILAIEKMQFYASLMNKTKFIINKIDEEFLFKVLESKEWFDSSFNWSIGNIRRFTLPVLRELGHYNHDTSVTGHIVGEIKPKIMVRNGKFFSKMVQKISTTQFGEWFYCSIDLPKLHIKQCHLVKNSLKGKIPEDKIIFLHENGEYAKDVIKSCRYSYNASFQPLKAMGLGVDLNNKENTEDSMVYKHIKNNNYYLYEIYESKVKDILTEIGNKSIDRKTLDLYHSGYSEEYYLGD